MISMYDYFLCIYIYIYTYIFTLYIVKLGILFKLSYLEHLVEGEKDMGLIEDKPGQRSHCLEPACRSLSWAYIIGLFWFW